MHNLVSAGFAKTVAAIGLVCKKHDITWGFETADTSFIVDARNKLVEQFLSRPERTHLLMCDSDSELGFAAVEKLITCGFPFASLPFCMRVIDLESIWSYGYAARFSEVQKPTFKNSLSSALSWCVDLATNDQQVVDGWVKARRTGFGCVLLERRVLEEANKKVVRSVTVTNSTYTDHVVGPLNNWFDRIQEGDVLLSEDMSFCERVKHIATPMLCIDQVTHHNGTFSFGARLLDDERYFRKT